jgi:hypothetical protein
MRTARIATVALAAAIATSAVALPATAAGSAALPFQAVATGTVVYDAPDQPLSFECTEGAGAITGSLIGRASYQDQICSSNFEPVKWGTIDIQTRDGSTLELSTGLFSASAGTPQSATWSVTAGTGRFAGADGSGTLVVRDGFAVGTERDWQLSGTLSLSHGNA